MWDPVEGAGGYNINTGFGSYLTTVKNRTDFQLQVGGRYSVIAFDVSATLFSNPFAGVAYKAGSDSAVSVSSDINNRVQVVSVACQNVGPGESCSVSCRISGSFGVATGGACATSDIVESDATAGLTSYSCSDAFSVESVLPCERQRNLLVVCTRWKAAHTALNYHHAPNSVSRGPSPGRRCVGNCNTGYSPTAI